MGLRDKLRETAQEFATEARKATSQGKVKIEEMTLRRKMDDAARRLGYLVFRERSRGAPAGSEADAILSEMSDLEDQIARHDLAAKEPSAAGEPAPETEPMESTPEGAAPAQSPPEGAPTDQPRS
jgi:hypothetical protein